MAEIIKSIEDIEDLLREAVLMILGLDPEKSHSRIRFPWGSNLKANVSSAPAWDRAEDVCVIYALPHEDAYNRQRNKRYEYNKETEEYILIEEFTDAHHFNFVNYGPHAYECARDIRNGLFRDDVRLFLKKNRFHLIPDIPAPQRVPEVYNEEWWNRVDVSAEFYEYVRLERVFGTIEEIGIILPGVLPDKGKENGDGEIDGTGGIYLLTERDKFDLERRDN